MMFHLNLLFAIFFRSSFCGLAALKQWNSGLMHTGLVVDVQFYNDNTKFVTGSKDHTVKIWSMSDYSLLHTITISDQVTHVSLHPIDNRIFVLGYFGEIDVYDPNTYGPLSTDTYPNGGAGNFLRFIANNTKFIVGGFSGFGVAPQFHIYDSTTYVQIGTGFSTTFPLDSEITVTSISKQGQIIGSISGNSTFINIQLYNLTSNTLIKKFTDNEALLKWISFNPYRDQFYVSSNDMSLKFYGKNPLNGLYYSRFIYSTLAYGYPNCINTQFNNTIVLTANKSIVFLSIQKQSPSVLYSYVDQNDVFVIQSSSDKKFLLSGMRNGEVTLWNITSDTIQKTKKDQDTNLLIILGASIGGGIILIILSIIICRFCCGKNGAVNNDDQTKNTQEDTIVQSNPYLHSSIGGIK